jgi:uncharacterized protein (TIGR04141 family)
MAKTTPSPPQADLTVYLLKEGTTTGAAIKAPSELDRFAVRVGARTGQLFVRKSWAPAPRWAKFFADQVDRKSFGSVSGVSAVLLIETAGRLFALTFGHGRLLLADDCWDERFGLKTALNSVGSRIRSVDKQTLDSLGRHARIQSSRDAPVREFGFDIEQDLLRAVTGRPADEKIGSRVTGMDSLRTTTRMELHSLTPFLKRLLDKSDEATYRRDFPWIDHVLEIASPSEINELDEELAKRLDDDETDGIALAVPVIIDWNDVSVFRYHGVGDSVDHVELSLDDALTQFRAKRDTFTREDLRRCAVSTVDAEGTQKYRWILYSCIHGEITVAGANYVLSAGRWFRVHKGFAKEIDEAFERVPKLATPLPRYEDACEGAYCQRVANGNDGWVLMDREPIRYGGGRSQVEFCDLFGPASKLLVHVKRYAGSSPLSHLFAQALVSGETFRVEPEFRKAVTAVLPAAHRIPGPNTPPEGYGVVLGIVKPGELVLPFFAKVALRHAVKRLRGFGYDVWLAHIRVSADFAVTKRARPTRRKTE